MYQKKVFKKKLCFVVSLLFIAFCPIGVFARTVYVSDLSVNIRSGPGVDTKVIAVGKKDESLRVVDENSSWFNVTLGSGKVGWISKKMVKQEKPYAAVINGLKERLGEYQEGTETLEGEVAVLTKNKQQQILKIEKLKIKNSLLITENSNLQQSKQNMWIGAAVFSSLLIWVMGFLAGHYRLKKEDKRLADMAGSAMVIPHVSVIPGRAIRTADKVGKNGEHNNVRV